MLLYNAQEPTDFESYQEQGDIGFLAVAGAQFDTFKYEDLSNSRGRNLDEELLKEVHKVHNLAPEMFSPSFLPAFESSSTEILKESWRQATQGNIGMLQGGLQLALANSIASTKSKDSLSSDWQGIIEPNLEALRERFPDANIRNRDEIDADIAAQAKMLRDDFEETYSYADPYAAFFGALGGGAVASMADPINIMTLPIGAGKVAGASFVQGLSIVVARSFGIGFATEAAIQPFVYDYKKEIESPYDLQDALFNMSAAGVGNGLLNGLGHGIARGFDKIVGKQELPDTHETRRLRKDIQALLELQTFADETGAKTVGELEIHLKALNTAMADIEAGRQVDYDSLGKTIEAEYLELFDVEVNGARATMDYIAQKRYELEQSFDPELHAKQEQLQQFADQKLSQLELKRAQAKADTKTDGKLDQETDLGKVREIQKAEFEKSVGEDTIRQNEEANIANNDLRASRRDEGDMIALKQQMDDLDTQYSEQVDYHSAAKKARDQYVVDKVEETNQAITVAPTDTPRMMAVKTAVNRIALLLGGQNIKVKVYEGNPDVDGNMRYAREAIDPSYKNTIIGKVYDSISDFAKAASKGKVNKAREFDLDQRDILDGVMPATEFDFLKIDDDGIGLDYEMGTFNKRLEDAGLYVIDNSYGKVIAGKTKEDALNLQNARTPIEYGKSYGYSNDDIAAFYLKRAGGIEELAYSEYQSDLNVSSEFGDMRYSLADGGVSTRVPTAKRATEDALTEDLLVGSDVDLADPITLAKNTAKIEQYDGYIPQVKNETPEQVAANFIAQLKDNLLWLHDQVPDDIRQRSHKWYVGANRITEGFAARYGYSNEQASGVMAALSPQKDWFMNASLGERVMDVYANHQNTTWSPEMEFVATDPTIIKNKDGDYPAGILIRNEVNAKLYEAIQGKKLSELDDVYEISAWIRSFDEAHNNRSHRVVTPEGGFIEYAAKLDGTDKVTGWGSFSEISKAVSVLRDGSPENISNQMGGMHKVRNFYNNILLPNSVNGHVTIDTHAVAASMLGAFSTKSTEVKHNFGQGSSSSSITGSKGTYGLHAEAYRQAAAARGILPRQMQSITWEAARGLFTAGFKGKAENVKLISGIWQRHKKGKITLDEARQEILNAADGINDPAWHRSSGRMANEEWDSSYKGDIPTGGLPRNTRLDEATGPRVGDDATRASSDPDGGVRYSKDGQTIEAAINPETGELHINASAFRDEAHLMEVMREEIIGHYGLRKSLGGDFQGVIDDIKSTAATNSELRQMWIDLSGVDPQTKQIINPDAPYKGMADDVIADEIISKMARKEIGDTTFMALKNIIIKALRKIGLVKDDITISEMRALVVKSEKALKKNVVKQPRITGIKPQLKQIDEPLNNEAIDAEAARIVVDETNDQVIFDQNGNTINLRDALMEDDNDIAGIESLKVCML